MQDGTNNEAVVEKVESVEVPETLEPPVDEIETAPVEEKEKELDELPLPGEVEKKSELPKWAEKRISKKEKEAKERAQEAEMYKAELEKLRSTYTAPAAEQSARPLSRDDYEDESQYIAAVVHNENRKMMHKMQSENQQKAFLDAEMDFRSKWKNSEEEGLKKYDDFDEKFEVLNRNTFPANRAMAEAIVDSPYKNDILYFLGTYPDHAEKIAKMTPIQAVKKVAEIEGRFAAKKKIATTKAPAILAPVKSNKGVVSDGNIDNMTPQEYNEWYEKKYRKR